MTELLVVIAVIGIMALIAIPSILAYWPAATVRGAARGLQDGLNQAKTRAIATRQSICVQVVPGVAGGYRFRQGGCGGGAWIGTGTDATGLFRVPDKVTFTGGASPVFTQFGTATAQVGLTVTGPRNQTLTVTVLASGYVRIP